MPVNVAKSNRQSDRPSIDVNIASRSATGGINNSTVALSDGRNLYQDFLGFVLWEFAPTDFSLVDRVEVVRGPIQDRDVVEAATDGVTHVLHLATVKETPEDAFAAVSYRDGWFWINDRDYQSKKLFSFLMFVMTLTEKGGKEGAPIVTISAGG